MSQMIIANRLRDGLVVFMTADGEWVESIEDGALIEAGQAEQMLEIGRQGQRDCRVIDPELIDVEERAGRRTPTSYREEIRARGPSVQAETS
jgi:hypothetical protein